MRGIRWTDESEDHIAAHTVIQHEVRTGDDRRRAPGLPVRAERSSPTVRAMWTDSPWQEEQFLDEDHGLAELSAIEGADELCRRLLESTWGWGSSSRCAEAVDLLAAVRGTGTLPDAFVAMLVCTCGRWARVTAKLIRAVEVSGVLTSSDLDELAESFLGEEVVVKYPFLWASPRGLDLSVSDDGPPGFVVDEHTMAETRRRPEPPLRRWAAARSLRSDPGRLDDLLACTGALPPRHREAALHGLLDASDALENGDRRQLIRRGLRSGVASVRRSALDGLCELDGADTALRRARADTNRAVRAWRPASTVASGPGSASGQAGSVSGAESNEPDIALRSRP